MFIRPLSASPEGGRSHRQGLRKGGRLYDWRLRRRRPDPVATGSAPDSIPTGLFSGGSHGSSSRGGGGDEGHSRLLEPLRGHAATPDALTSSRGAAVLNWPHPDDPSSARSHTQPCQRVQHSRTASADSSSFDDGEERCIHTAYRVSFQSERRIQERPSRVVIAGTRFLLVERVVTGHSDGVYQRNKKIWEQVPRGQLRVFAPALPAARSFLCSPVSGQHADGSMDGAGSSTSSIPRCGRSISPNSSFGCGASSGVSFFGSRAPILSLNGLRKFAHWGDASVNTYHVNKETPATAIAMQKVDGEGCHLAAFSKDEVRYWVVGLRDRHLLVRLMVPEEDLSVYVAEDDTARTLLQRQQQQQQQSSQPATPAGANACTRGSIRVARAWGRWLHTHLSEAQVCELHELLTEKQWTLCFDAILSGFEHFVDYYSSDEEEADDTVAEETELGSDAEEDGGETAGVPEQSASSAVPTPLFKEEAADLMENEADPRPGTECSTHPIDEAPTPTSSELRPNSELNTPSEHRDEELEQLEDIPFFFYAITTNEPSEKGLCLPLAESMALFARYRLPAASYSEPLEVNSPAYDAARAETSSACNSAGSVFYGSNASGLVVRMWKCRCHAYELERAAQEFIVTHRLPGRLFLSKFRKKLSGLAKDARASSLTWERVRLPFLAGFADWLHDTHQLTPSTDLAALQELRGHWLTAQHAYRHAMRAAGDGGGVVDESDHDDMGGRASGEVGSAAGVILSQDDTHAPTAAARSGSASTTSNLVGVADGDGSRDDADKGGDSFAAETILLAGPQGCGKSTLARALYALLEQAGCTPRWVNQDEVGSRNAYLTAVKRAATEGLCTHILLDKMNLDEVARTDYNHLNLKTVLTVAWSHRDGATALADVCFERVRRRGAAHRTFKATLDLEERDTTNANSNVNVENSGNTDKVTPSRGSTSLGNFAPTPPSLTSGAGICSSSPDAQLRRIKGILMDCTKRYEVPDSCAGVLLLDVTLNCNATLQRVWTRLRDRSLYELPELGQLDTEEAFRVAFGYEELMRTQPHRVMAAALEAAAPDEVRSLAGPDLLEGGSSRRAVGAVQVVLHNFVEQPSPTAVVRYAALAGRQATVTARAIVADTKATLLVVSLPNGSSAAGAPAAAEGAGSLRMAVLARSKKTSNRYCMELFERAVLRAEPDPYVTLRTLPPGSEAVFTYTLVMQW